MRRFAFADEVALRLALQGGLLDRLPPDEVAKFRSELAGAHRSRRGGAVDKIQRTRRLDATGRAAAQGRLAALAETLAPAAAAEPGSAMMAERLAEIVAQIQNVHQLGAVVTAMRGIAASRAQQARVRSLPASRPIPM